MDEGKIREYAALMKELDLTGIEINEKKGTIRLERRGGISISPDILRAQNGAAACGPKEAYGAFGDNAGDGAGIGAFENASGCGSSDGGADGISSPMVGVFYSAPAKDAEPFVHPGDSVKKGQVVCIIESMKLMNEIQAEEDCVIAKALVNDGESVEYGTKLFAVTA